MNISVFFLILEGCLQSFPIKYNISCGFFINPFYQVEEVSLYFQCVVFIIKLCWILSNSSSISNVYVSLILLNNDDDDDIDYQMLNHLWILGQFSVMVYDPFHVFLYSICCYFIEDLKIYLHRGIGELFSYSLCFWYYGNTSLIESVEMCFFLF